MGFKIVEGSCRKAWYPIDRTAGATSLYVGQLVQLPSGSYNGVTPIAAASGAADTSTKSTPLGIVTGTSDAAPTYTGTYGQYITSVQSVAGQVARRNLGIEGMHGKGDPQAMVEVACIDATTVIRAGLFNATYGVAPTVVTATAVNGTAGLGMTTGATDVATVANMCTTYCRTGANAGVYRVNKSASATVHTYDTYWPYTLAIGDTFVIVPVRQGQSYVQVTSTTGYVGMGFDVSATPATNYFIINVLELDLREAGKESVLFKFAPVHFDSARA